MIMLLLLRLQGAHLSTLTVLWYDLIFRYATTIDGENQN